MERQLGGKGESGRDGERGKGETGGVGRDREGARERGERG